MTATPIITTERLRLDAFCDADIDALAAILADPEVTKNITADGSTPERCRASAAHRIGWHNASWSERGYGVWAVRECAGEATQDGRVIGWCGFAAPDVGEDPEILYGLSPLHWRRGLAQEMVRAAFNWLFLNTQYSGISAVIFARINPVSVAIARKLDMNTRGTMPMSDFLPDLALARSVLDYEIWRLGHGSTRDAEALLFQAPFKGGQIASLGFAELDAVEQAFIDAALRRADCAIVQRPEISQRVRDAFRQGVMEPWLDWYHLDRATWLGV